MTNYSILIFDEGFSAQKIFPKFAEQELGHLAFSSNGKGGIAGAIQYLSRIEDSRGIEAFLISSVRSQSAQKESEQRKLAEALRDTANAINQSLDLHEVLDCILNKVGLVVPNDAANIMLIDDGIARMAACRGYERMGGQGRVMKQVRVLSEVPNLLRMIETGQPLVIPDTKLSTNWIEFETSTWIHSYASVPISLKGRIIGFLNLNSATANFYDESAAERLLAFADQAAIAIENARLYAKAQREIADRKRAEIALQQAMNELEERVTQRTAELSQTNELLKRELARRKQAEQSLEEERALLASRVEERTAELSAANAELAKAVRLKDTFLANMSHELRTPLNAILNISETLREEVYGELNAAQERSVNTIEESGRHLLTLINDILDLSKIGAGKFELNLDSVSVQDVCRASLQLVDEAARKKMIAVTTSFDPDVKTIWADQRRIKQILLNLLSNAVKFTPAGGTVGLTVAGNRVSGQVEFTVWDTGIGIPVQSLGNLFKPFVQLDNTLARQYEGTGLGLALVYHIVELHGGGVRVESEVGMGSRFIVTFNWHEGADLAGQLNPAAGESLHPVESDWETASAVTGQLIRYLQEMSIEAETCWIEKGAPVNLSKPTPDFFILDCRFNGSDLTAQIQQDPLLAVIPQLRIGIPGEGPVQRQVAYLNPPFTRQDLRVLIKQLSRGGTASLVHKAAILNQIDPLKYPDRSNILIVDDNENGIQAVSDYLTAHGFHMIRAYNGIEALEQARDGALDLILMDVQMPGMDGLEAIRYIRADQRAKQIPIFAFTALAMPGDRERCLEAGANEYLSKPLRLKHLVEIIETYLHQPSELRQ